MLKSFKTSPTSLLLLLGVLVVFAAIPLTVNSLQTVEQTNQTVEAATPCTTNCGEPRYFCDTWNGGFCDDYRDLYCPSANDFLGTCRFPDPSRADNTTVVSFSSTDPNYDPHVDQEPRPHGWFFNQQEHFHSQIEDGSFGMAMMRLSQPFDFTGREGHAHFDIDLKTSARRYPRFILSPELTFAIVDDRNGYARPANALDIWFINGTFQGHVYKNGTPTCVGGCGNAFSTTHTGDRYYGVENVRDHVDVYVRRNHVRILINGTTYVDQAIPDIGFDKAYMYLGQASYNPCKDNECALPYHIFHWDNVAFDGPVLPNNSLIPAGSRDVMFNVGWTNSCTVKGVNAAISGLAGTGTGAWVTYVARLPDNGTSVTSADVSCNYYANHNREVKDFKIVKPASTTTTPPLPPHGGGSKPGDINGDGKVGSQDLLILVATWGTTDLRGDLNGDNVVNSADMLRLVSLWGS